MDNIQTPGTCYICGCQLAPADMKKHIQKEHAGKGDDQECVLLKVEGRHQPEYWLYLDMPLTGTLSSLDKFLRKIWLECCGHMSAFSHGRYDEIGKGHQIGEFASRTKLFYDYDFGSTTELVITVMGHLSRPKQRNSVRLLARNNPFAYQCEICGKEAVATETEYEPEYRQVFYCETCADEHVKDYCLPVTNSPRMGECGYCGEFDKYAYKPPITKK